MRAMVGDDAERGACLVLWQRLVRRRLLRMAGKRRDEPLTPEDWEAYFKLNANTAARVPALPEEPAPPRDVRRALTAGGHDDGDRDPVRRCARLHGALGDHRSAAG